LLIAIAAGTIATAAPKLAEGQTTSDYTPLHFSRRQYFRQAIAHCRAESITPQAATFRAALFVPSAAAGAAMRFACQRSRADARQPYFMLRALMPAASRYFAATPVPPRQLRAAAPSAAYVCRLRQQSPSAID
jgi:hypothetical protein